MQISYIKGKKALAFRLIVVDLYTHHGFQAFSFTLSHFLNSGLESPIKEHGRHFDVIEKPGH